MTQFLHKYRHMTQCPLNYRHMTLYLYLMIKNTTQIRHNYTNLKTNWPTLKNMLRSTLHCLIFWTLKIMGPKARNAKSFGPCDIIYSRFLNQIWGPTLNNIWEYILCNKWYFVIWLLWHYIFSKKYSQNRPQSTKICIYFSGEDPQKYIIYFSLY